MTNERKAAKSGNFEPLFPAGDQGELPGIPAPARPCKRCGQPVPAPKREGRPTGFCSETCRKAAKAEQVAAWRADNATEARGGSLSCWTCGAAFPAPPPGRGRAPRYCGPACRAAGRRDLAAKYRARRRRAPNRPKGD